MASPNQPDKDDARTSVRKKTLLMGTIVFGPRAITMPCAIFDLSDTGARLKPADTGELPEHFELQVPNRGTYQCKVIHKSRSQIGVRFV